jgi:hypothetical protein
VDSNADNSWTSVNPNNSRGPTATWPPKTAHASVGTSNTCQYTIPSTNQYAVLSNNLETQQFNDTTFSSDFEQPTRFLPKASTSHVKGHHWKKPPSMKQRRQTTTHQLDNSNLQEQRKNNDGTCHIPTIVNGVTNVNHNPKHKQEDSNSTSDSVSHIINLQNTEHKIVIIGDSHARGSASNVKHNLNDNYKCSGFVRPGANTDTLISSVMEDIKHLTNSDAIVFMGGTNDVSKNNSQDGLKHVINFVKVHSLTNIILMSVPHRHDLPEWSCENGEVKAFNRKSVKLMKPYKHVSVVKVDLDRKSFNKQRMHMKNFR